MSVLIKTLEMPVSCWHCDPDFAYAINCNEWKRDDFPHFTTSRPDTCPLIELDDAEIVMCKDCKHHHYSVGNIPYCDWQDYGYGWKDDVIVHGVNAERVVKQMRLIDADALLERMTKAMESGRNLNGTFHLYIEHAPTITRPTGEWIPVSEKPKDEKRTYLVQLDSGGMRSCRWTNANPIWTELTTDWHWNIFDIPQYCKVVAWMDLESYREDGKE